MENNDILSLWKAYDKQLEESLVINQRNAEEITKLKVKSFLSGMKPIKLFTILIGIIWVAFVDVLIINSFPYASAFFLISAIIQVVITKLAIGIYAYQLILIEETDISGTIIEAQEKIARLKSSTLWVTRLLILQLPVWTTFYLRTALFTNGNYLLITVQIVITLLFLFIAIWFFVNINIANKDKKWFRLIFAGKEWSPLMHAMDLLNEIKQYKQSV